MRPLVILLVLCLAVGAVFAAEKKRTLKNNKPVEMTSNGGIKIDLEKQVGTAIGDVVIRRSDIVVCCDEAELRYANSQIERVSCSGRVVIVRPDGTRAVADKAIFRAIQNDVTLQGGARVVSPRGGELVGERIIYDIGKDRLDVDGKASRFSFAPDEKAKLVTRPCPPEKTPPFQKEKR